MELENIAKSRKKNLKKPWGPALWIFFHTLVEKMYEQNFTLLAEKIFNYIYRICELLPCASCSIPSVNYLNKVDFNTLITCKDDFRKFLCHFHNFVNIKTKTVLFRENELSMYETKNLGETYTNFLNVFKPKKYIEVPYNERHHNLKQLLDELDLWLQASFSL